MIGCYISIALPLTKEYNVTLTELRVAAAIEGLRHIYGWRLGNDDISLNQIARFTAFTYRRTKWVLSNMTAKGIVSEERIAQGKRTLYRYRLTKTGKTMVNKLCQTDKVHERIVDHLYKTRLLK